MVISKKRNFFDQTLVFLLLGKPGLYIWRLLFLSSLNNIRNFHSVAANSIHYKDSKSFKNMFLCRFIPFCGGYCTVFLTLGLIILFFYWKSSIPYGCLCSSEATPKAYSELTQTSKMELFAKVISCWEPLTNFTKNTIVDIFVSVPFEAEKCLGRRFIVNFASSLCIRKKFS